jgi:hypothetical protein
MTPERFKNPRPASADRVIRISIRKPLAGPRLQTQDGERHETLAYCTFRHRCLAPMYPSKNIIQNAVNSKDHTTLSPP